MNINVSKLKGKMAEAGFSNEALARAVGMNASTFYRKMKARGLTFTIEQMHNMVSLLKLSEDEAKDIFLGKNSQ